jgi:GNAT superfamily N-acetyltransferase
MKDLEDYVEKSPSNYSLYAKERMGEEIIEDDKGFVTYEIVSDSLWIRDMFVRKEHRGSKIGKEYYDRIVELAKNNGCKYLKSHVDVKTKGWNISYDMLIAKGFQPTIFDTQMIYLVKEI